MELHKEWSSLSDGFKSALAKLGCTVARPHILESLVASPEDCWQLREQLGAAAVDSDAEAIWKVAVAAASPAAALRRRLLQKPVAERIALGDAARHSWAATARLAGAAWALGAAAPTEKPILDVWRTRRKRQLALVATPKAREDIEKKERERWTAELQLIQAEAKLPICARSGCQRTPQRPGAMRRERPKQRRFANESAFGAPYAGGSWRTRANASRPPLARSSTSLKSAPGNLADGPCRPRSSRPWLSWKKQGEWTTRTASPRASSLRTRSSA